MTETGRYVAEEFYRRRLAAMEAELTVGNYETGMDRIERYRKINNISHHNMKHYTDTIPVALAKKLKEAGLSIETEGNNIWCPSYAEAFDWLMDKNINIYHDFYNGLWSWFIESESDFALKRTEDYPSWHEAANAAIEKALELIKED